MSQEQRWNKDVLKVNDIFVSVMGNTYSLWVVLQNKFVYFYVSYYSYRKPYLIMLVLRHNFLSILILCAVLLQGLIPVGFMPNFDGKDNVSITICTANGFQEIFLKDGAISSLLEENGEAEHTPNDAHDICPYAVSSIEFPSIAQDDAYHAAVVRLYASMRRDGNNTQFQHSYSARAPPQIA